MPIPLRINVTGNAGAGKTMLAHTLGEKLGHPVHGLDSIVWRPHWQKTPSIEKAHLIGALTSEPSWIIDGVSKPVRDAADIVVVLDTSRPICLYRAVKRNSRFLFKSRPGLPENCPEILILPELIKIIMRFPKLIRSEILSESLQSDKFHWLSSNQEIDSFIHTLTHGT